jgi:hypothetical protein
VLFQRVRVVFLRLSLELGIAMLALEHLCKTLIPIQLREAM